ncbi:MAG: AAA family ATPase [Ruminococcaceae bacterium]|nr:AAA family ATPase [Oscillospiraceae bacterium]
MGSFGLLGEHLGHSYSPRIHALLADYAYELFEVAPENLEDFLKNGDFPGMNVTIPYKKAVIPYCAELSDRAKAIGSVNTILRRTDGTLYGDNTDFFGFSHMLRESGVAVKGRKILVLGDGGAATTVRAVLKAEGASQIVTISRRGENNYENLHLHRDAEGIVNTTPVGMYPNNGAAPLDLSQFPALQGVWDLIYNPARTALMLQAEALGIPAFGGLKMLVAQAWAAAEEFVGHAIDKAVAAAAYRRIDAEMRNIALIGMPGCGKTTTSQALAELTGREVIDVDEQIVRLAGRSIPEIFASDGEEAFRAIETQALSEISKKSGVIISTGGGVVTRTWNLPLLQQNSAIVYLRRETESLATDGRPLSQSKGTAQLAAERLPLYEAWADHTVQAGSAIEAAQIIKEWIES